MPDREKVIRGLECCTAFDGKGFPLCEECPYADEGTCPELDQLHRDALELLKAQEPRVMAFEEVQQADAGTVVWFEQHTPERDYMNPMVSTGDECVGNNFLGVCLQYITNEARGFRFWSARPTDEQREATPWEPPKEG